METKKKSFKGGFTFKGFQGYASDNLENLSMPETVRYPLPHTNGVGEALVSKGDTVKAGQLLWQNDELPGSPVIATINGTVESLKPTVWNGRKIPVVTVKSDGTEMWTPVKGLTDDVSSLDAADIEEALYFAGVASLGRDGIPTRYNTSPIQGNNVEHLIISHCEDEVYNIDLSVLLGEERFEHFNAGLLILKKIMPHARLHMVLNRKNKQWCTRFSASPFDELLQVKPKFPQGMDSLITETITGKRVPAYCTPANASSIVLDVQAVLHVFDAVKSGKPLVERIISLAGPGFSNRSHVKVRMGTSFEQIIQGRTEEGENRYILNSAMTGASLSDLSYPIDPSCSVVVALKEERVGEIMLWTKPGFRKHSIMHTMANSIIPLGKVNNTNMNGEERACLSCGNCYNVCPAGLYPTQLFKYVERDKVDEIVMRYGILKCIDCNLCTYVCTAKIPLAEFLKEGKAKLIEDGYASVKEIVSAYDLKETES